MTRQVILDQQDNTATPTLRGVVEGWSDADRGALASAWRLPAEVSRSPAALANAILQPEAVRRVLEELSGAGRAALIWVQELGGRVSVDRLTREYGALRANLAYPSPRATLAGMYQFFTAGEQLFLLGLLVPVAQSAPPALAIPSDLLALLPPLPGRAGTLRLAPAEAPPIEAEPYGLYLERHLLTLLLLADEGQLETIPAGGLNKASLLHLAKAWKAGNLRGISREEHWPYVRFLRYLAEAAGLLRAGADAKLRLAREASEWMRRSRSERARTLLHAWVDSRWDELVSLHGLKFQRALGRNVSASRRAVLRLLEQVPPGQWITFADFITAVKRVDPDFARPDGRYDTWGIQGPYRQPLDGFEYWDQIEGKQLRDILSMSLYWLGLVDVGIQDEHTPVSFRLTPLGAALIHGGAAEELPVEPIVVQPNFEVVVPLGAALHVQFELARFADLVNDDRTLTYTLTRRRLQGALERGAAIDDLLRLLAEQSGRAVPQNVAATLREWGGQHGRLALRTGMLLEADDPALLEQVRRDKRLRLPEAERLSETTLLLREADAAALAERLRKAGYGLAGDIDAPTAPLREHDLTVLYAALEFYAGACDSLGIESEASGALRQRVRRLLSDTQLNRAARTSYAVLQNLNERLGRQS